MPPVFQPGDRFRNQLDVVRLIGEGYSGQVYEVNHIHKQERFALKVMHLEDTADAEKVARALAAARAHYAIQHANVVRVEDIGCEPDGMVWALSELLTGATVGALIGMGSPQQRRLSPRLALTIAIEAAWGLAAAHENGVIHRDVKPENLFLTKDRSIKVLDFWFAKVFPAGLKTTKGKVGLGTLAFMAPEHLRGATPTPAFDVYGLGVTLWLMLSGSHPFEAHLRDTQELIRHQLNVAPLPVAVLAGLPSYADDVVLRALAKEPADRYPTIRAMAGALSALLERLERDAAEGKVRLDPLPGEPMLAERTSVDGKRDYQSPRPTPDPDVLRFPSASVKVAAGLGALGGTAPLTGTVPLAATKPMNVGGTLDISPSLGPGGTVPIGASNDVVRAVLAAPPPPAPPPPASATAFEPVRSPVVAKPSSSTMVDAPMSAPPTARTHAPRRSFSATIVIACAIVVSLAAAVIAVLVLRP